MKKAKLTRFLILWVTPLFFLVVLAVSEGFSGWNSIPASVEEVTRESEIIVLGKVIATDPLGIRVGERNLLYTRHSFLVEKYFLGEGPRKISLLTMGGRVMRQVGDEIHPFSTRALGSEQVKKGEEMLAFLRKVPGGFFFVEWDGAKYLVENDPESEGKVLKLRLRKKRYMRGQAFEAFETMEKREKGPNQTAKVQASLIGSKYLTEIVSIEDLPERMMEIIQGEKTRPQ